MGYLYSQWTKCMLHDHLKQVLKYLKIVENLKETGCFKIYTCTFICTSRLPARPDQCKPDKNWQIGLCCQHCVLSEKLYPISALKRFIIYACGGKYELFFDQHFCPRLVNCVQLSGSQWKMLTLSCRVRVEWVLKTSTHALRLLPAWR